MDNKRIENEDVQNNESVEIQQDDKEIEFKEKKGNIFSKIKNVDSDTKSTYFYGIIFVFIIIVALIVKFSPSDKKNNTVTPKQNNSVEVTIDYEKDLNTISDNYELDVVVNKYYINEYVNVKKQGLNELINVKKVNSNNNYTQDDKIDEDIDMTFITPQNILKLISVKSYNDKNKYMVEASKWIEIYNELNGTNLEKSISGEITVEFLSDTNGEYKLAMDLTNLYKNLNYEYESVIYNIKFYNINKINIANNN